MKEQVLKCGIHNDNEGNLLPPHKVDKSLKRVWVYDCCGQIKGLGYIKK